MILPFFGIQKFKDWGIRIEEFRDSGIEGFCLLLQFILESLSAPIPEYCDELEAIFFFTTEAQRTRRIFYFLPAGRNASPVWLDSISEPEQWRAGGGGQKNLYLRWYQIYRLELWLFLCFSIELFVCRRLPANKKSLPLWPLCLRGEIKSSTRIG